MSFVSIHVASQTPKISYLGVSNQIGYYFLPIRDANQSSKNLRRKKLLLLKGSERKLVKIKPEDYEIGIKYLHIHIVSRSGHFFH